jgi:uncharacterized protein DUF748
MGSKWRARLGHWSAGLAIVVVVLIAARAALPWALRSYVNRLLAQNPNYSGQVGDVDVALYRGAYKIHDVDIRKRGARVPVDFVRAPLIDVSVEWQALLHGKFAGELVLQEPELNFVAGPSESQRQSGKEGGWRRLAEALFPAQINRFEVQDGKVHFRNFSSKPNVNVALTHFDLIAENLSGSRGADKRRPGRLEMRGDFEPTGHVVMHMALDPHSPVPSFDTDLVVKDVELSQWNDFLKAYAKLDAQKGKLSLYGEMTAGDGGFHGYVKPFFEDIQVIDWAEVTKQNLLSTAWEAFAQGVLELFKNHAADDVATRIPITGSTAPQGEFWPALGNALYNAFIQGLAPRLEHSVGAG